MPEESTCLACSYLQTLTYRLKHVGNYGIVPQVCKPHLRTLNIHGTGQEEAWSCRERKKSFIATEIGRLLSALAYWEGY